MACFPAKRVRASINYFNQQYKLLCLPLFSVTYFLDSGLTPMWCVSKNFYETRVFLHILNPPVIILPLPRRQFLPIGSMDPLTRAFINLDILTANSRGPTDESTEVLPSPQTATSTYYKQISISGFSGKNTDPLSERITLTNRSRSDSISITGWEFETSLSTRFTIPSAYNLPGTLDASLR